MIGENLNSSLVNLLQGGTVIPAHPLALSADRSLDERHQRALTRYYIDANAGGVAVGVHTTQFEIRQPKYNLLEIVLRLASEEIDSARLTRPFIKVAGIVGPTEQAVREAELARSIGYHFGLLSNGGLGSYSERGLIERLDAVSAIIPVFGFYLQPAVGGRILSFDFWQKFAANKNVMAIKVAAFNRYQTLDVMRAVCTSNRADEIAMYTGNDDNIVADLLTPYRFGGKEKRFVGGLLGHWAFGTQAAVTLLDSIKQSTSKDIREWLSAGIAVTDINAAVFDPANNFQGCIAGINEVLRRQGLMKTNHCLNENERLSDGQAEEITRVLARYPQYDDSNFIKENLDRWLK